MQELIHCKYFGIMYFKFSALMSLSSQYNRITICPIVTVQILTFSHIVTAENVFNFKDLNINAKSVSVVIFELSKEAVLALFIFSLKNHHISPFFDISTAVNNNLI